MRAQLHRTGPGCEGGAQASEIPRELRTSAGLGWIGRGGRGNQIKRRQAQCQNCRAIGRGKQGGIERLRKFPGKRLTFTSARLAIPGGDPIEVEQNPPLAVVVLNLNQRTRGAGANAKLLLELTREGVDGRFARLQLAAGEFPPPALMDLLRPPRDQHPTLGVDQGTGDDMQHTHQPADA